MSPFPPAHRLIELHWAHREYVLLFSPPFLFFVRSPFPREKFRTRIAEERRFPTGWAHSIPRFGPRVGRGAEIHSEAAMRAGISAFAQFGFMVR